MLDLDELKATTLNPIVTKEIYLQAEKRLIDVLDTKKSIEQKASTFFSAYLTVSLALFGIGVAIFKEHVSNAKALPFFLAGAAFVDGALIFILALKDQKFVFFITPPLYIFH